MAEKGHGHGATAEAEHDEEEHGHKGGHVDHGGGHEEGGGHAPLWIVSFADMVILLMSFFVMMLATSSQKDATNEQVLRIIASIKVRFGYRPQAGSKDALDLTIMQLLSKTETAPTASGTKFPQAAVKGSDDKQEPSWTTVKGRLGDPVYFRELSAELPSDEMMKVGHMAEMVVQHHRMIIVMGHCAPSEVEEDTNRGHDIALKRATTIAEALVRHGISASRIRLVSCAAFETILETEGRHQRRAELNVGSYFTNEGGVPRESTMKASPR